MSSNTREQIESVQKRVDELEASALELERTREALRESEEQYRSAFEYTGTAMMLVDEDTIVLRGNQRMEVMTGYTQEEVERRQKWTGFVVAEDRERLIDYHTKRRDNPGSVPSEYEFRMKDGQGRVRDVLANVSMVPGTRRSLVSLLDITERKQIERALRESEQRFKEIAELLPGIICEMDLGLKLTYVNEMGLRTFGFTREEFDRGIVISDLIPDSHKERVLQDIHNISHDDYGNPVVYQIYRKNRSIIDILINSAPIRKNGEFVGIRCCIIDISDRVRAEEKVRASEERFRAIYESSPIGLALFDLDGSCADTNESFRRMFHGETSDSLIRGLNLYVLLSCDESERAILSAGGSVKKESLYVPSQGTARCFEWHVTPFTLSDTRQARLVQVQDITESKEAQEARVRKEREATVKAEEVVAGLRRQLVDAATFNQMVSRSPAMKDIFDILPEVAGATASVLITGESGTGKELIARSLHEMGPRKNKAFVAINCSALPDTLLESELFGYKAGAFTDARRDKAGKFAIAEGGTVFLDEIGDISPAMQAKLLRVLQEKTFEPLGATSPVKSNIRFLAATNKDLVGLVKEGVFREDLYYRINVVTIKLPPLRERRGDIPLLCEHFVGRFNGRYGKSITGFAHEALALLVAHEFPGNIRELENVIEHAFIFCKGTIIESAHFPESLRAGRDQENVGSLSGVKNFDELEKIYIKSILSETGGSRIKAAQRLGVHKATLFRKMKQLGIQ